MRRHSLRRLILIALTFSMPIAQAVTVDMRLRIRQTGPGEPRNTSPRETTITRENLIKIQQFIIKQGKRETYCSMYGDNPAHKTKNYRFYLNPDSGQMNMNCDLKKSGFYNLTIRKADGGKNQYRTVEFLDKHYVYIASTWPTSDLTVQKIRQVVVDAMKEILIDIKKK